VTWIELEAGLRLHLRKSLASRGYTVLNKAASPSRDVVTARRGRLDFWQILCLREPEGPLHAKYGVPDSEVQRRGASIYRHLEDLAGTVEPRTCL
jgi:hypothetical protein